MTEQRQGVGKKAGRLCRGWNHFRDTRERFARQRLVVLVIWTPTYLCTGTGLACYGNCTWTFLGLAFQDLKILSPHRLLYLQRVALCCPQSPSEPSPSLFTSLYRKILPAPVRLTLHHPPLFTSREKALPWDRESWGSTGSGHWWFCHCPSIWHWVSLLGKPVQATGFSFVHTVRGNVDGLVNKWRVFFEMDLRRKPSK